MENRVDWEELCLMNELTEGMELVKQLRNHLDPSSLTGELLIEKTLSSLERALSLVSSTSSSRLNNNNGDHQLQLTGSTASTIGMLESPHSVSGSPQSDNNNGHRGGDVSKKSRKGLPRWSEQIKVCPGTGLEGPVDDGQSWRKYGQKDILGAKYPRGYYRCTYRNVQGCLATKQVQRSDENPLIFDVTYRGRHTCMQSPHLVYSASQAHQNINPEEDLKHKHQKPRSLQSQEILLNFSSSGFEVKSEDLDILPDQPSAFSFPSSTAIACIKSSISNDHHDQSQDFVGSSAFDHDSTANYFMGSCSFSPPFTSPADNNTGGVGQTFERFESDFNEIVSIATTSVSNSQRIGGNFTPDELELDPNFLFGTPGFLC